MATIRPYQQSVVIVRRDLGPWTLDAPPFETEAMWRRVYERDVHSAYAKRWVVQGEDWIATLCQNEAPTEEQVRSFMQAIGVS